MTDDVKAARPLIERGQRATDRYWRAGPGTPAALPLLREAIEPLDEAYGCLDPADTLRGQTAAVLGSLYATRHLAHAGADQDRERGIFLLEEALSFPTLPPAQVGYARLALGQLLLRRAMTVMEGDALRTAMLTGRTPETGRDADRSVECFRAVIDAPVHNAEMARVAQATLTAAEAMQDLLSGFGGGPGGFDLSRMMAAVQGLQRLQQQAAGTPATQFTPAMPSFFDAEDIAGRDPRDRPTTVMEGAAPAAVTVPRQRPEPVTVDAAGARRALDTELANAGGFSGLLHASPPGANLDKLVALATAASDDLRLALALYLRSRTDTNGWGEASDGAARDATAAAEALAAAAGTVSDEDLELFLDLAARLDRLDLAAVRLAPATEALRTVGVDALVFPRPGGALVLNAATGRLVAGRHARPERAVVVGDDIASVAQLVLLAARPRRPVVEDPVFVANPRGDLEWVSVETMLLRRLVYPRSTGLGRTIEYIDGPGTATEVRERLGASLLVLGCGITPTGVLDLAGPTELDLTVLPAGDGGLVVLPVVFEGFPAVADALIAAGCTGVVGWHRPVPAPIAAALLFVLHLRLVDGALRPAEAVQSVRRSLLDPDRKPAPGLPEHHAAALASAGAEPCADALAYRGV